MTHSESEIDVLKEWWSDHGTAKTAARLTLIFRDELFVAE
jgi:hypothetical protein